MLRLLLAPDKFKGCLSAAAVAAALQRGFLRGNAQLRVQCCPIADGGEGTAEAMVTALGGHWQKVPTVDALGVPCEASIGLCSSTAVMEMSAASGLALVADRPLEPQRASTYGTGLLLRAAMGLGALGAPASCRFIESKTTGKMPALQSETGKMPVLPVDSIIIGIGGSATNDGGCGMAAALGFEFLDAVGKPLLNLPADLLDLHHILSPALPEVKIKVACDVTNPLLGPSGATRVYGPQKGVTEPEWFEQRLEHLASVTERCFGRVCRDLPGAGAAGGLGWGLMTFLEAELQSGFDLVAAATSLEAAVIEADVVITGEGRLDAQTLSGKGPAGVAALARKHGKRVIGIGGSVTEEARASGLCHELYELKPTDWTVEQSMREATSLLEALAHRLSTSLL